jgi:hypothetical protein
MSDNRAVSRGYWLALLLLVVSCGPQPPTARGTVAPGSPASFVIPTVLPNGRVEVAIRTGYVIGTSAAIPVIVIASRGVVTGPVTARIVASGIGERGRPSETLVATLAVAPVSAKAGQAMPTSVSWNGRDDKNELVPADAYSLLMDFRLEDGSVTTTATAGATLQWNSP